jgi:hypothetical protein
MMRGAKEATVNQWTVVVKDPHGNRKRSRITSVVVDREPTPEGIKQTVAHVARLLVDDLYGQASADRPSTTNPKERP